MTHEHGVGSKGCKEIFSRLSEYLDEELDPDVCERVDAHMDGCDPCRVFLESLKRTVTALRDVEPIRLPDDVRDQLLEAYRNLRDSTKN